MHLRAPKHIAILFLILLFVAGSFVYFPRYRERLSMESQLANLLAAENALPIGARGKSSGCILRGSLPDADCTPGAVFSNADVSSICEPGYTKTVRNVPIKLRRNVFGEYDISYPQPKGDFEVDHLIPLALGGSNGIANLFPQRSEPTPGFREKDIVENYLHEEVCAGRVALSAAQGRIANDWIAIYDNLSAGEISRLKTKFRNWSE